jgi:hypothetical protein
MTNPALVLALIIPKFTLHPPWSARRSAPPRGLPFRAGVSVSRSGYLMEKNRARLQQQQSIGVEKTDFLAAMKLMRWIN